MPAWAWWGLISIGLFVLGWLCGRLRLPQAPAGYGPWETSWAVYFSPNGGATDAILAGLRGAKRTILVHAYLLYSMRPAGALVSAHQRGVRVHVILDAHAQPHDPPVSAVARLVAAGIAVSLDAQHAWAHDKVMILDGEVVITGSYNWTVAAEQQNGENLLVIRDSRLAGVYTENWWRHAHHSTPYEPTASWRARVRTVWVSLIRRGPKWWDSGMGEDGSGRLYWPLLPYPVVTMLQTLTCVDVCPHAFPGRDGMDHRENIAKVVCPRIVSTALDDLRLLAQFLCR